MHTNEPPSLLSGRHLRSFCFPPIYLRRIGGRGRTQKNRGPYNSVQLPSKPLPFDVGQWGIPEAALHCCLMGLSALCELSSDSNSHQV